MQTAEQVVNTNQQRMYDFSIVDTATNQNQRYAFLITPVMGHNSIAGYMLLGRPEDPTQQLPRLAVTLGSGFTGRAGGGFGRRILAGGKDFKSGQGDHPGSPPDQRQRFKPAVEFEI